MSGVVYVLQYTAKQPYKSQARSMVTSQAMTVSKLTKSDKVTSNGDVRMRAADICKFQMIRQFEK
jgi:hypothetical protein